MMVREVLTDYVVHCRVSIAVNRPGVKISALREELHNLETAGAGSSEESGGGKPGGRQVVVSRDLFGRKLEVDAISKALLEETRAAFNECLSHLSAVEADGEMQRRVPVDAHFAGPRRIWLEVLAGAKTVANNVDIDAILDEVVEDDGLVVDDG